MFLQSPLTPIASEPAQTSGEDTALLSRIGKPAPDFVLPDPKNHPVRLSSARGKWIILIFYPVDLTRGLLEQFESYSKNKILFDKKNTVIWSVSTQGVNMKQFMLKNKKILHVLLSDINGKISSSYGVLNQKNKMARRVTFYIDPSGKIAFIDTQIKVRTAAEDSLEILERIRA
jgi:peroxiredoxin